MVVWSWLRGLRQIEAADEDRVGALGHRPPGRFQPDSRAAADQAPVDGAEEAELEALRAAEQQRIAAGRLERDVDPDSPGPAGPLSSSRKDLRRKWPDDPNSRTMIDIRRLPDRPAILYTRSCFEGDAAAGGS